MTQILQSKVVKWVIITAVVLAVPALAMALQLGVPDPGSGTDGVNWGPGDFLAAAVMILGAGLLYEWAATRAGTTTHRIAVAIMAGAALLLVWANLAVGIIGEPGNPGEPAVLRRPRGPRHRRVDRAARAAGDVARAVRDSGRSGVGRRDRAGCRAAREGAGGPRLHRSLGRVRPAVPASHGIGSLDVAGPG